MGFSWASQSTLIYTSELILCSTICELWDSEKCRGNTIYMLLSPEVLQVLPTFTTVPIRFRKREKKKKKKKENYCCMSINLDLFLSQFVLSNHQLVVLSTFLLTRCFQNCFNVSTLVTLRKCLMIFTSKTAYQLSKTLGYLPLIF